MIAEQEIAAFGTVTKKKGKNFRTPYKHQQNAMCNLDLIDDMPSYSTLVVLPTGGGKTYTASMWLLRHALNEHKKILWIAHRQMLLEQAAESFTKYAYDEVIPKISSFDYRIVSGATSHERTNSIVPSDNLLIASKDSLGRNMTALDGWLDGEDEVYLIIDEAHHSTAKTYRRIIEHVQKMVPNTKVIGLTATPFRTAENEQGLLAKIYKDGIRDGQISKNDIGITYQIGLKDLIGRQILAKPIFESAYTEESFGNELGVDDWNHINQLDILPDDIARQIAASAARNKLIVETYKKNQQKYGQTLVFAVNVVHAITLAKLFNHAGIPADFIVSSVKDMTLGVTISREENEQKIEDYRNGNLKVLVNVNILTEGVDLPQTKTVFLARPTVSTILMTQMIGRALRGQAAGGTSEAYIVSFIDDWSEHIAWVNPESIFVTAGEVDFDDNPCQRRANELRMIAISKIEEFAAMLDDSIDTTALEKVSFEKRIPVGMYAFTYLEENGMDHTYQVMVYDSTKDAYIAMMEELPELFSAFQVEDEEFLADSTLRDMAEQCRSTFFLGDMIPPYEEDDVIQILKYYAQYSEAPKFYTFDDIDRNKLDVASIARHIYDEDMGPRKKAEYVDSLWDSAEDDVLRLFFGKKLYFWRQLDIELMKITQPLIYEDNVIAHEKNLEDLPLHEIGKTNPDLEKRLRDGAFEKAKNQKGQYVCQKCGLTAANRVPFQVDHIVPMNKGGKSTPDNLQILCRSCNARKSDKY